MTIISPYAIQQFFDDNGDPLAGGKLYTYEAGTTTLKTTYTDSTGSSANTNPIILDSAGRATVWLDTGSYKFVLDDSADVNVDEVDNITGAAANVFGSSVESISTNTNITTASENVLYQCTASLTLSLLAVASAGEGFIFGVTNTGSGTVTIDPDGAETIDGLSTIAVEAGQSLMIVCTGTAWLSIFLNTTNVTDQTSATITATDELIFGDVSDSSTNKKDTVQGVLDLVAGDLSGKTDTVIATGDKITFYDASDSSLPKTDTVQGVLDLQNFIQRVYAENTAATTHTTAIPYDDSIPQQSTEGESVLSVSITPTSATNRLIINVSVPIGNSANDRVTGALFQDSAENALMARAVYIASGNQIETITFTYEMAAGTTSSTTFKVHVGGNTGTVTLNGVSGSRIFGGVSRATIQIFEVRV